MGGKAQIGVTVELEMYSKTKKFMQDHVFEESDETGVEGGLYEES